jgi:hypothetical protein
VISTLQYWPSQETPKLFIIGTNIFALLTATGVIIRIFFSSQESFHYQQPAGPVRHPGPEKSLQVSGGGGAVSVKDPELFLLVGSGSGKIFPNPETYYLY